MNESERLEIVQIRNCLNLELEKFQTCPDRLRSWELNLSNEVVFAIEGLEKLAGLKPIIDYK